MATSCGVLSHPNFFRVRVTSGSMLLEPMSTEEATTLAAEADVLAEEKQA